MEKMNALTEKFLMFENEKNNCWLDASLSLISYNKTFEKIVENCPKSQIRNIIKQHEKALAILNDSAENIDDRIKTTRALLVKIQQSTLHYLQCFSNFKEGEPDSAFCALLNLILQDKSNIKEHLGASWIWMKHCTNCGNSSKYDPPMKPIITLPKVKRFQPECPISFYTCSCKKEQEMKLKYKLLPPCLMFHFEKGAGDGKTYPLTFKVEEREYYLTAVVVLEKSNDPNLNHFVTYIRQPSLDLWLDCNDLNTSVVSYSSKQPEFALKDVCMYVYEAFDNLGKITNKVIADSEQSVANPVEFIDLEVEEAKQSLGNINNKDCSSKPFEGVKKKESLLNSEKKLAETPIISESEGKNKNGSSKVFESEKKKESRLNSEKRLTETSTVSESEGKNKNGSSKIFESEKKKESLLNLEKKLTETPIVSESEEKNKVNSSKLFESEKKKESMLNLDKKLAETPIISESKGKNKDSSSKLFGSEKPKESVLNSEIKLVETPIISESKGKNKAVNINNLLKKAIKERKISSINTVIPVIGKESNKPDINCDMLPISSRFAFQKVKTENSLDSVLHTGKSESYVNKSLNNESKNVEVLAKESSCNFSGDKNINTSDENKNKDENDLQGLTGISASESFERNAYPMNFSSKPDCHDKYTGLFAHLTDEPKFKSVDSGIRISKNDEYLTAKTSEMVEKRKKEAHFEKAELSSVESIKNKWMCLTDYKYEINSEMSSTKKKLDKIDIPVKNSADDTQTKLEDKQRESISSNTVLQKTTASTGRKAIDKSNQQTSTEKSGIPYSFASTSKHINDEIKHSSSEDTMSCEPPAEIQVDTLLQKEAAESESDYDYDEKELQIKMKQTSLKRKKGETKVGSSNKKSRTVDSNEEASTSGLTEANDEMKTAVRKSPRISSKLIKVKWSKTSQSPSYDHTRQRDTDQTDCDSDGNVDAKVAERNVDEISPKSDEYVDTKVTKKRQRNSDNDEKVDTKVAKRNADKTVSESVKCVGAKGKRKRQRNTDKSDSDNDEKMDTKVSKRNAYKIVPESVECVGAKVKRRRRRKTDKSDPDSNESTDSKVDKLLCKVVMPTFCALLQQALIKHAPQEVLQNWNIGQDNS